VHGAPLGAEETAATRKNLKWEFGEFEVPADVKDIFLQSIPRGAKAEAEWEANCKTYAAK
jgi:transketolase